jgi:hypothetical protein
MRIIATTLPSLAACSIAGPDEVLFSRKGLAVLHDAKFSLSDMTDHSVHHLLIFGTLRFRLKDDVTHRNSL